MGESPIGANLSENCIKSNKIKRRLKFYIFIVLKKYSIKWLLLRFIREIFKNLQFLFCLEFWAFFLYFRLKFAPMGLSPLAPGIYVIYIRLQSFVIMPSSGMSSAGISIIAYNYGAREKERIMDTLWKSLRVNAVIAVAGILVFLIFPAQLLAMFNASGEMMKMGIQALRFIAAVLLLTTTTQILSGFLQAMGQGTASFIVSISQAVFLLLFAWLFAQTGSTTLVWLAFPAMEIIRFAIAAIMVDISRENCNTSDCAGRMNRS